MVLGTLALLVGSLAAVPPPPLQLGTFRASSRWVHFGADSGLPDERVVLVREGDGVAWAGTVAGLARYDGYLWHPVGGAQGLPEEAPTDLAVAADGRVLVTFRGVPFVGDATGAFAPLEPVDLGAGQRVPACETLPDGRIAYVLAQGEAGWQLRILGEDQGSGVGGEGTLQAPRFLLQVDARREKLWIVNGEGLASLGPQGLELRWPVPEDLRITRCAIEDGTGRGIAYVRGPWEARGIWEWRGDGTFERVLPMPDDSVVGLHLSPTGEAVALLGSGRVRIRGVKRWSVSHPPAPQMLGAQEVRFRPNGDLWVSSQQGLHLFLARDRSWRLPGNDPQVLEYLQGHDGRVWVGTTRGVVALDPDGSHTIPSAGELGVDVITALAEDRDGNLWIGSGAGTLNGALRRDGEGWTHFGPEEGLGARAIHRIRRDRRGRLWFLGLGLDPRSSAAVVGGGAYLLEDGRFEAWTTEQGLSSNRVYDFLEDPDGTYWFATWVGISAWREGSWRHWGRDQGLRYSRVFALARGPGGRIFFGHQDSGPGLGWIEPDGTLRYAPQDEPAAQSEVAQLVFDERGCLWVACNDGVRLRDRGCWLRLTHRQGLASDSARSILPLADRVLVATEGGGIDVLALPTGDDRPPRVTMGQATVQGVRAHVDWSIRTFWGAIPDELVATRHRLNGGPWSSWSSDRQTSFEALDYGSQVFEVQVRNLFGSGRQSQPRVFRVERPLHLRLVFLGPLILILGLSSGLSLWLLRKRRRSHEALADSEGRFRQLAENVRAVFWLSDCKTRGLLYISPIYQEITGHTVQELLADGRTWRAFVHRDDQQRLLDGYAAAAQGSTSDVECRILHRDGNTRWLRSRAFPIRNDSGEVYRVAGVAEDVTAQRLAEDALRQSEGRYRSLVEATPDAIVIHRAGRILFVNPAAVKLHGASCEADLIGKALLDIIHPDYHDAAIERIESIEGGGTPTPWMDQKIVRLDGELVDVEATGSLVEFDGRPAVQAVVRDITGRKRGQERQRRLMRELDHRVKNNLASVLALAQQSLRRAGDMAQFERSFTERLRSMARVHEALAAARWEGVRLEQLARLVVDPYRGSEEGRMILEGPDLVVAAGAATPLCTALHELATNAAKHGALSAAGGRVRVSWQIEGNRLVLRWEESGGPTVEATGSEGLGLSLMRGMIEYELLGSVKHSLPATGVSCELRIPAEYVEPARATQLEPALPGRTRDQG